MTSPRPHSDQSPAVAHDTSHLPRTIVGARWVVGIGCRRGVSAEAIESAVWTALTPFAPGSHALVSVVQVLASIDAKADEPGLRAFADRHGLPLRFFSAQTLAQFQSPCAPDSDSRTDDVKRASPVHRRFGVSNVCEAAARAVCPDGTVVLRKTVFGAVTIALLDCAPNHAECAPHDSAPSP